MDEEVKAVATPDPVLDGVADCVVTCLADVRVLPSKRRLMLEMVISIAGDAVDAKHYGLAVESHNLRVRRKTERGGIRRGRGLNR